MISFFDRIQKNPIIAEVNNLESLTIALNSPCEIIFVLTGNIFNLKEIANKIREKNKGLYIHVDSIHGFSKDTWGLEYIIKNIYPDGIISEKDILINLSKNMGIFTIQNLFIVNEKSLENSINSLKKTRPNVAKISPGIIPKITKKIITDTKMPVISSGLISSIKDVDSALDSGSIAISSSNKAIWYL